MATQKTFQEAIMSAIDSATVDRSKAESERVQFEPGSLTRVTDLFQEPGGDEKTKQAWREVMNDALADPIDPDTAIALYSLKDRLTGSRGRVYEASSDGLRRRFEQPLTADQEQEEDLSWFWPPGV
ncbi:hypothetical protein [Kribbella sp. NPDC051620]|uniref:hypothetical protein n=1 Tax=Kribbella sp. NPDC051620 TaxID=3364120 RepID=UPI0037972452